MVMARKGNNRRYQVIINNKPTREDAKNGLCDKRPALCERGFWVLACGVILISIIIRIFDFSLWPPAYKGLYITQPYTGLHSRHFATQAWAARSHVKYVLGYTKGYRTLVVGEPPSEQPLRWK